MHLYRLGELSMFLLTSLLYVVNFPRLIENRINMTESIKARLRKSESLMLTYLLAPSTCSLDFQGFSFDLWIF